MNKLTKTLARDLGYFIGEGIRLPILSIDCTDCRYTIQVNYGESKEHDRLLDVWNKKYHLDKTKDHSESKEEWNNYQEYRYMLKAKYLPHVHKVHLRNSLATYSQEIQDIIKDGIISSLWDSDTCNYMLESDSVILENSRIGSTIILKLSI